jgi:superfamily II DNA/RNA helicase
MLDDVRDLKRDDYKIEEIVNETYLDMDGIVGFLKELKKFQPAQDDKLKALVNLLKTDPVLKEQKVLVFSEFMATARYLKKELTGAGIAGIDEVDSYDKRDRGEVISQFAPYYNGETSAALAVKRLKETRVLISTDVLSEGLNLQDATRLINYDLHWNPVRLMQRIGRVDRRLNNNIEKKMLADHPEQKSVRGTSAYWNFLPPDELENLLNLYRRVSGKALKISKVFGIEGKKLLRPDDDYDALKDFVHEYEGAPSTFETMRLEYQKLLQDNPGLEDRLTALPGRVFSGKEHRAPGTRAVFFCYALPAPEKQAPEAGEQVRWTADAGYAQWYLCDMAKGEITEDVEKMIALVRSGPETPRHCVIEQATLKEIRRKVEQHIRNSYLKKVQAPAGVKPVLIAWMELS